MIGTFAQGKANGNGTYYFNSGVSSGSVYIGQWKDGK